MDYRDTPGMNDILYGIADEEGREPEEEYALGAVGYRPAKGWLRGGFIVMTVNRDGQVKFSDRPMDRAEARRALQRAASLVSETHYDQKAKRFIPVLDPANAKPKRTGLSPRTRWEVLERDGRRCRYCGASSPDTILHVDHVKSRKDGGTDDPANLVTACRDCNLGKGSRSA